MFEYAGMFSLSDDDFIFLFKLKSVYIDLKILIYIQVVDQKSGKVGITSNWVVKHYVQYFGLVDYRSFGFVAFVNYRIFKN